MSSTNSQKSQLYPLLGLFFVILIDTIGFGIIFPVISPLFMNSGSSILPANTSIGMRDLFYGLALGIFSICMFITGPILGDLSDQLGRKRIILFCLFGSAVSALVCAWGIQFNSIALLLFGRAIAGILAGSQPIAQAAIADISQGKQKTKNIGLIALAGAMGFVIGPIMGGFFSDQSISRWFNYTTPFYIDAVIALLNAFLLIFSFEETQKTKKALNINLTKCFQVFKQAFKNKKIRNLSIAFLLTEVAFSLYFQFITLFLVTQFHYTSAHLGLFLSFLGLTFTFSLSVVMRIVLPFSTEHKIAYWAYYISAIGFLIPIFFHGITIQWLAVLPIVISSGVAYNAVLALFSNSVSAGEQGWAMGISSSILAISWILGSILVSLLFYFNPILPFYVAALLSLIGAVLLQRWK